MKKMFKLALVLCIITALLVPGISLAAHDYDYDHIQSGYGVKGGFDCGNASWSLYVCSSYANSQGYLTAGATGYVFCAVDNTSYQWTSADCYISNNVTVYGDGTWAEIWFHDVVA